MKSLLKFALFCLFFLSFSQVGFGQVDKNDKKSKNANSNTEQNMVDTNGENPNENRPYTYEETLPEFPGGNQKLQEYLITNLRYPRKALENNLTGIVLVKFDILETGEVANVHVIKGVHSLLDKEAVRLIKDMPHWHPGTQNGKKVKFEYNAPVKFNLENN